MRVGEGRGGGTNLNYNEFLIRSHGGQAKINVAKHFSHAEGKKLSTQSPISEIKAF